MDTDEIKQEELDDSVEMEDTKSESESSDSEEEEEGDAKAYVPGSTKLEEGEELVMDQEAYVIYHQASLGPPCLSFDVIKEGNEEEK